MMSPHIHLSRPAGEVVERSDTGEGGATSTTLSFIGT